MKAITKAQVKAQLASQMKTQRARYRASRLPIWLRLFVVLGGLVLTVNLLSERFGEVPPLGPLLNPFNGIWAHRASAFEKLKGSQSLALKGLTGRVVVQVDQDQVKHIFADNDEDLYFAQGYIVASDRLWQMDFLTRLAGGRLSEIVGRRGLEYDKLFLRLGLPQAAKESAELMLQDSVTGTALQAYVRGVNAYIQSLKPSSLPFEYKLLGHEPETWTPYRAALLMKFMAYNLSMYSRDLALTRSYSQLGPADFDDLFPLGLTIPEPIVPKGTRWQIRTPAPESPQESFQVDLQKLEPYPAPHPANGSNNWAVTGKKSTTGRPILSNDIHLSLSLPSLWYEVQLSSPSQNVYGVTLPGAPGVILGFNQRLAWGVTNGSTDVLDWYELRFRDEHKNEYLFDGQWRPVISQEFQVKVRGEADELITMRRTHFGPIVYDDNESPLNPNIPKGLAMRWGALEPSNELKTFLLLNRAKSTAECRVAIETFQNPDQNFLCADNSDDVGLWHMGRYPLRWRGQGRMISDGSSADYEWKGWIPRDEVPFVRNPERGFVSSANQAPADDEYPHYLGWPFESPFRAMRINEILRSKNKFSPEDIVRMQADTLAVSARTVLPHLLKATEGVSDLSEQEKTALEQMAKWDYRFEEKSTGAPVYYRWFKSLETRMWKSRFPDPRDFMYPPRLRTVSLIESDPASKWFDDPATEKVETLRELARAALSDAVVEVESTTGKSDPEGWTWAGFRSTQFAHAGKIEGLGEVDFPARGMEDAIFANSGSHGPVWKLVVALGPEPKAWGIYPGGQSGDPTSSHYSNFLEPWRRGEMKELVYLKSAKDQNPKGFSTWTLEAQP